MKTVLAVAAALGLSASVAVAACPGHHATTSVDKDLTVASISTGTVSAPAEADEKEEKAE